MEGPAAEVRFCLLGDDEEPMVKDGRSEGAPGSVRERSRGGEGDDCEAVRAQTLKMSQSWPVSAIVWQQPWIQTTAYCALRKPLVQRKAASMILHTPPSFLSPHRIPIHTTCRSRAREPILKIFLRIGLPTFNSPDVTLECLQALLGGFSKDVKICYHTLW